MKVREHSHLRGKNGCLGFFYGLDALLSAYPEGGLAGEFFINGKTQSIWVWDSTGRSWYDTNHAAPAPFFGVVTDPATFSPAVESGQPASFVYVAGYAGSHLFPALKEGSSLTVVTDSAAIITLVWDGSVWRDYVTPLTFDDAIRPIYMYRGQWNGDATYTCANGVVDVAYFMGRYYRVKDSVGSTSLSPGASSNWEEVAHFYAVADRLEMLPDQLMVLDQQQTIRTTSGNSSWELCNGEIRHLESGTFLSQSGELRVSKEQCDIIISPTMKGLVFWGPDEKNLVIDWDTDDNIRLTLSQSDDSGSHQILVTPQQITLSKLDSAGQVQSSTRISPEGMSGKLKLWSDTLAEGDIYVDENNFLKQKRG